MRRITHVAAAVALAASLLAVGSAARAAAQCAQPAAGGEWRSYGRDLSNSRNQAEETTIDATNARDLTPAWTFSTVGAGGVGSFQSTPVIADGCVFVATTQGEVYALNADTGGVVWDEKVTDQGGLANGIFAVAVANDKVYANVSRSGSPVVVALDQDSGAVEWESEPLDTQSTAWLNSSVVVHEDLVFAGFSTGEGDVEERGGYVILDADTGEHLKKVYPIPDEAAEQGQGGAGIWATAVVDPATDHLFVGTGNPFTREYEHRYSNAIIKVDLSRDRGRFGEIVDAYKGDIEQYYPPLAVMTNTPVCKAQEIPDTIDYPQCGQIDIDFGASPNLFTDDSGDLIVGELQKSGVYHAAYADTMQKAWTTVVGAPMALGNAATSAVDDDSVYVAGAPGSVLYALDKSTGAYRWAVPLADGTHYEAVSAANGLVYAIDTKSTLQVLDGATGVPVAVKAMPADVGDACATLGGGAAIARGTVYAVCDIGASGGGWIIAYSLPS